VKVLSGTSRRHLRALGHHLQPVVHVGKEGLSAALVAAVGSALGTHELIKVRLSENAEGSRHELSTSLAESTSSELVEALGRTVLLYRRHPTKPKIVLPVEKTKGTRTKRSAPAETKPSESEDPDEER
jgi:RNA-binding protein